MIRNLGAAGIRTLGYNFKPIGNFRTTSAIGRGGARYSTFDYDEFMEDPADVPEKYISEEQLLENLRYFLARIVPVAEEAGVNSPSIRTIHLFLNRLAAQPESSRPLIIRAYVQHRS